MCTTPDPVVNVVADFMNRFTHIHVADRSVDMSDLRLDAHENHRCWPLGGRCLGPCIGCMQVGREAREGTVQGEACG